MKISLHPALAHRLLGLICLTLAFATPAGATNLNVEPVSEETLAIMSPEAREAYDEALDMLNYVLYPQALRAANRASELTPTSIELHYFCIEVAEYLAKTSYGQEAQNYFDVILDHLETIGELPRLTPRQAQRVEFDIAKYRELRTNVFRRDELRRDWGIQFATEYSEQVFPAEEEEEDDRFERLQETVDAIASREDTSSAAAEAAAEALAGTVAEDDIATTPGEEAEAPPAGVIETEPFEPGTDPTEPPAFVGEEEVPPIPVEEEPLDEDALVPELEDEDEGL